jgi:hypothetical protein
MLIKWPITFNQTNITFCVLEHYLQCGLKYLAAYSDRRRYAPPAKFRKVKVNKVLVTKSVHLVRSESNGDPP